MAEKKDAISEADMMRLKASDRQMQAAIQREYAVVAQWPYGIAHSCGVSDCAKLTVDQVTINIGPPNVGVNWTVQEEAMFPVTVTNTSPCELRKVFLEVSVEGPAKIHLGTFWLPVWKYYLGDSLECGQSVSKDIPVKPSEPGHVSVKARVFAEVVPYATSKQALYEREVIPN